MLKIQQSNSLKSMTIHPWTITETGAGNNLKSPIFILNDFKLSSEVQRTAEIKSPF